MIQTVNHKVQRIGHNVYSRMQAWTHGRIVIPVGAAQRFSQTSGTDAASSLAFYAVFSLFPLLGVLVSLASYFVPRDRIHTLLLQAIITLLPVSVDLISQNIDRFIELRGTVSLVGTLGLLWSASSGFTILVHQIDRAWEQARVRSFFQRRMMAIGMIAVILLLVALLWIFTGLFDLLAQLQIPILNDPQIRETFAWKLFTVAASPLVSFLLFFVLYRWMPSTRAKVSEAAWGALVVTVLWSLTGLLFGWYVGSGLATYNLLYGSLAALAVLMFWFYPNSMILLFGAHLCASIAKWREKNIAL